MHHPKEGPMQTKITPPLPRWAYGVATLFWAFMSGLWVVNPGHTSGFWHNVAIIFCGIMSGGNARSFADQPRREREYQEARAAAAYNQQKENGR
jgi:hypothetical protein